MKQRLRIMVMLMLPLICTACNVSDGIEIGAEAATVTAVIALRTQLPEQADKIIQGMKAVDATCLSILQSPEGQDITIKELVELIMVNDPDLDHYRAIINFVLPVILKIPKVREYFNIAIKNIPEDVRQDLIAFFTGVKNGLGVQQNTTLEDWKAAHPKAKKYLKKYECEFDITDLSAKFKALNAMKVEHKVK